LSYGGSVQHLKFLSDNEKEVFKTFGEIDRSVQIYLDKEVKLVEKEI
jgi:hypothetical protein